MTPRKAHTNLTPDEMDRMRRKIRGVQIIKRLGDHVAGKLELSSTQVRAGLGLLAKTLPDLGNVEISGQNGGPMKMTIEWAKPDAT